MNQIVAKSTVVTTPIVLVFIILLTMVHSSHGGFSKKPMSETNENITSSFDSSQALRDLGIEDDESDNSTSLQRRRRQYVSIWTFVDTKYTMAHADRTVFYKSLPFFNESSLTEDVNLTAVADFNVLDIIACNMETHAGLTFEHYGVVINVTMKKILEFGREDKSTWYQTRSMGTINESNVTDFQNRYFDKGCKLLRNPYPALIRSITDKKLRNKVGQVYKKWLNYADERIKAFRRGHWWYNLYYCNCQVTVLYIVYGFGGYGGSCLSADSKKEKLIYTNRDYIDAVYDYCYIRDLSSNISQPMYGNNCEINNKLYHRHSSLRDGDYENEFKLY